MGNNTSFQKGNLRARLERGYLRIQGLALEAANYRGSHLRPEGDRILILEDTHHTGKCDSYKVFVQDKRLFAPLADKWHRTHPRQYVVVHDHPRGDSDLQIRGFRG